MAMRRKRASAPAGLRAAAFCLVVAASVLAAEAAGPSPSAPVPGAPGPAPVVAPDTSVLRQLVEAHADSMALALDSLRVDDGTLITVANREEWIRQVTSDLRMTYAPEGRNAEFLPLAMVSEFMSIEMGSGRTPEAVVEDVVRPGHVVRDAAWHLRGGREVKTFAVFGSDGALLFDSILVFPIIRVPFLDAAHW